jgi:DNA-binding MarR family transcriptional regulator
MPSKGVRATLKVKPRKKGDSTATVGSARTTRAAPLARTALPARTATAAPAAPAFGVLDDITGYHLRQAQTFVYRDYWESLRKLSVRPVQYAALVLIDSNPGLTQGRLAQMLLIERSNAVALVDSLEAAGWAKRSPAADDKRAWALSLTAKGKTQLKAATQTVQEHDLRTTSRLDEEERALLKTLLKAIYL